MNLEEFIRIHDKNQFEIKLEYLMNENKKKTEYNINLYLFLPYNLGINSETYPKKMFYDDFFTYVRLISPKISIEDIKFRTKHLTKYISKHRMTFEKEFEKINYETRILMCAYRSYLRDFVSDVKRKKFDIENIKENLENIRSFRKLMPFVHSLKMTISYAKLEHLLASFCEFSSMVTELHLHQLLNHLRYNAEFKEVNEIITSMIKFEVDFKEKNNFTNVSKNDLENERLTFRYSVFKKYFYSILFLDQDRQKSATKLRHFAYAIAAGISMIFTTTVVFVTQKKYGNFTTSFFVALVISYMFKDRIKDIFKHYFDMKLVFRTFDFKNKIYDSDKKKLFGCFKERMRMIKKSNLSKEVIKTRLKGSNSHLSTWYLGEEILKYERFIKLKNHNIKNYFKDKIDGINDIMRFNISNFTKKMDDPKVALYSLDEDIDGIFGEKVYHVNAVIEFKSEDRNILHKIRIILTKNGIKRIEVPEFDLIIKK